MIRPYCVSLRISTASGALVKMVPPLDVSNPADGSWLAAVANISNEQSRAAVRAADDAFKEWSLLLPQERAKFLRRWNDLILENREDLALLMTLEQGKSLDESRGEIDYGASFVEFYSEEAKRPNIEGVTSHLKGAEVEVWREPLGVAGLITPWNFPNAMLTRKAAAALAAGCTIVAHPCHETPLSALALAELAKTRRFPQRGVQCIDRRCSTDRRCLDENANGASHLIYRINRYRPTALSPKC